VKATAAITDLLKTDPEWRAFYRSSCEAGALRLRATARRFRAELRGRDHEDLALVDVEDALLAISRKVLPKTLAAQWDQEWAAELCADALARISERFASISAAERDALDLSSGEAWQERMHRAGLADEPAAFRKALAGWERATIEAIEAASRSGAA
jgi:hypothetical protein